jgi:hypothetical protein
MDVDPACQGDFGKNFFAKFSGIFLTRPVKENLEKI